MPSSQLTLHPCEMWAERWGIQTVKTNQSGLVNLYIGLLDRLPTAHEIDLIKSECGGQCDFTGFQKRAVGYIMMPDEFKTLEPTERGTNLRLGLTLGGL